MTSGAKFMSAYPITPSSEIMEYMVKYAPAEGGRDAADGRRDFGLHDGDRRSSCRRPRFYCDSRPRLIADGGSNRPGGNDGNPAGRD